jgi:hypothetical protein
MGCSRVRNRVSTWHIARVGRAAWRSRKYGQSSGKTGTLHLVKQPPPESLRASVGDRFTALFDRIVHH